MAGRFPFDPNRPPPGVPGAGGDSTNAQMRAALGLPSVDELSTSLYVEEQRRLEAQHRDLRFRHALYQDQLDTQLHELRIRANAAAELELNQDPLQQHYAGLLLQERLGRAEAEQAAAAQQQQAAALYAMAAREQQYNAHQAAAAQAALRYQEEIRQHQQAAALRAHLRGQGVDVLAGYQPPSSALAVGQTTVAAAPQTAFTGAGSDDSSDQKIPAAAASTAPDGEIGRNLSRSSSVDSAELEEITTKRQKKHGPNLLPLAANERTPKSEGTKRKRKSSEAKTTAESKQTPAKRKRGRPRKSSEGGSGSKQSKKKDKTVDVQEERMKAEAILQAMAERASGMSYEEEVTESSSMVVGGRKYPVNNNVEHGVAPAVGYGATEHDHYNSAETQVSSHSVAQKGSDNQTLGTIGGLLSAADSNSKFFEEPMCL